MPLSPSSPSPKENEILMQCFRVSSFTEKDALYYFDKFVEGTVEDRQGNNVLIDEEGIKFMYKDPSKFEHIVDSKNFLIARAKLLLRGNMLKILTGLSVL